MPWEFHVLVVANVTATSDDLVEAMRKRAERGPCRFTLLVPAGGSEAFERLEAALRGMRKAKMDNVSGQVGDPDPVVAVMEAWDPMVFDEILVSTLPTDASRWLQCDLPHRLERLTAVTVRHVVSTPRPEPQAGPAPARKRYGVLAPLAAAFIRH